MILSEVIKNDGLLLIRLKKGEHVAGTNWEYDVKEAFTGKKRGWVYLDAMSIGALRAVYNGLNEENKAKFNRIHITKLLDLAWKHVKVG